MKNSGKIISVAILSAAAGVAAGLLNAPEKGEKTRKKLNDQAKKYGKKYKKDLESSVKKGKKDLDSSVKKGKKNLSKITS